MHIGDGGNARKQNQHENTSYTKMQPNLNEKMQTPIHDPEYEQGEVKKGHRNCLE
jgi:hypothetical protein